jgi:hypothetical protein
MHPSRQLKYTPTWIDNGCEKRLVCITRAINKKRGIEPLETLQNANLFFKLREAAVVFVNTSSSIH